MSKSKSWANAEVPRQRTSAAPRRIIVNSGRQSISGRRAKQRCDTISPKRHRPPGLGSTGREADPTAMKNFLSYLSGLTRRELFRRGGLVAVPAFWRRTAAAAPVPAAGLQVGPDIYRSIGIKPVINCRGTFTIVGG